MNCINFGLISKLAGQILIQFTPNQCIFREKELFFTGIGIDCSKIRFRFPTLESSTRFPESILDALFETEVK